MAVSALIPAPTLFHVRISKLAVLSFISNSFIRVFFSIGGSSISKSYKILFLFAAEALNTADYVAIGTSIGIAVLILVFIGFFLCRAQNRGTVSTMGGEIGQVSLQPMLTTGLFSSLLLLPVWNRSITRLVAIRKKTHAAVTNLPNLIIIEFSRNERTYPNFVSQAREIEIFCEHCKLAAPLAFLRGFGLRFRVHRFKSARLAKNA